MDFAALSLTDFIDWRYFAGILHSVSDLIQNLPNFLTTPNKMISEDDIKGLVSLKFLRPW
jgi:hypothetical protein